MKLISSQLGIAFQRQLDDDLATRLRMLKSEKQYLRKAFDLEADCTTTNNTGLLTQLFNRPNAGSTSNFNSTTSENDT